MVNRNILKLTALLVSSTLLSNCSQYKSSWTCKNPEGIGCSSIVYADQVARKHIILNADSAHKRQDSRVVLIKEHYSDFEKVETKEVELE